jgi:2-polyprenyl-3-methyl-5-hydroxy-6-metoxy-1,4-benzoquinol methylase
MYKTEEITAANRKAWNQVHPIHKQKQHKNLLQLVKDEQYNAFDAILTQNLQKLKLKGKKAVQICCNNGRETISLAKLGAVRAVGIDISELAIQDARQLSETAGTNCEFIASDIYDVETKLTGKFDLALITIGVLNWMPDLPKFFEIVGKMLNPGGHLVIYEMHPFLTMLATPDEKEYQDSHTLAYSYFETEAWVDYGLDYYNGSEYEALPHYDFTVTLSQIINNLIQNKLKMEKFEEFSHDISNLFSHITDKKVPMSYLLVARKKT